MDDHNSRMVSDHIGRIGALEKEVQIFREWRAGVVIEHETLLEGVANFRSFQNDAREFFHRADERAKTEKEFHNTRDAEIKEAMEARHRDNAFRFNVIGIVLTAVLALLAFLTWRDTQQKNSFASPVPGVSYSQPPQEGKLPK